MCFQSAEVLIPIIDRQQHLSSYAHAKTVPMGDNPTGGLHDPEPCVESRAMLQLVWGQPDIPTRLGNHANVSNHLKRREKVDTPKERQKRA